MGIIPRNRLTILPNLHSIGRLIDTLPFFGPPRLYANWQFEKRQRLIKTLHDQSFHLSADRQGEWICQRNLLLSALTYRDIILPAVEQRQQSTYDQHDRSLLAFYLSEADIFVVGDSNSNHILIQKEVGTFAKFMTKNYLTFHSTTIVHHFDLNNRPQSLYAKVLNLGENHLKVRVPIFTPNLQTPGFLPFMGRFFRYLVDHIPIDVNVASEIVETLDQLTVEELKRRIRAAGQVPVQGRKADLILQLQSIIDSINEV